MDQRVKRQAPTLRAEQAEQTRQRIMAAATELFLAGGYAATALQAIAARAGVAVETVYSRFRNKSNLLAAILEQGILPTPDGRDILDQPEVQQIRATTDQEAQVGLLAAYSRGILERTNTAHRILGSAAEVDPQAHALRQRDTKRRIEGQRRYIDLLLSNGPIRRGVSPDEAAATYSALASPETYALLTGHLGWSADRFETWLAESLRRLLL